MSGFGSFGLFKWISRCVSFLNEVLNNLQPLLFCPLNLVPRLLKLVWFWFLLVAFKDFQGLCECCKKLFVVILVSINIYFSSFRLWCLFVILEVIRWRLELILRHSVRILRLFWLALYEFYTIDLSFNMCFSFETWRVQISFWSSGGIDGLLVAF